MANIVSEMVVRVGADTTQLNKGLAAGKNQMNQFVQTMGQMGRKMTMGFTLPVAGAAVAATKMAMDFEAQMTDVFTLMDDATIASRNWSDEILDLSKKVPQSTDVLSKGLYDIISSGIDAADAMDVLGVSSKAATAGVSDTATAVKAITSVLNAYGLEASEATDIADTLFTTVKVGVTTFPELANSIGRVISTASAANVSFDEVGIALATMTQAGLSTEESVVALNQVILAFLKPGSEAQKIAEDIGFRFDAVTLATEGLGGALSGMTDKMKISIDELVEMERAGMDQNEIFKEMETRLGLTTGAFAKLFPNVRALKGFLALTRDDMEAYNIQAEAMTTKTGNFMAAFEKQSKTAKFQWDLTLSSLKATGIEIGNIIMPEIMKLVTWIGELADKFGELPEPMQQAIVKGVGIAAIVPPILWATSSVAGMITKIKGLRTASIGANAAALKLATGTKTMGAAAASAAGPLGIAAAAMAALAYGGHKAWGAMGKWVTNIDKSNVAGRRFAETLQGIVGIISGGLWTVMIDNFKQISLVMKIAKEDGIGFFSAWREYSHWTTEELKEYIGVVDDVVETEADRLEGLKETLHTLGNYALSNEELMRVLQELEQLYNSGYIEIEGYEKAIKHLMDSGGDLTGMMGEEITTGIELADSMGILADSYYEGKEAREAAAQASEDHATAMDKEKRSLEDLLAVMFQQYNQNASIVEQIWAYQDAQERLQEYIENGTTSTKELTEAEKKLTEAQAEHQHELENLSSTDAAYQKLLQEHHILSEGGNKTTAESIAKMKEINNWAINNSQTLQDLQKAEEDVAKAREDSKKSIDDSIRSTREFAELYLSVNRVGQQLIGTIGGQIQKNQELEASDQLLIDSFQSIRDAVIHVGLDMVQAGSISYGELEEWASHAGIKSGEIVRYWEKVRDEFGMIPNFTEIDILANDLATDTVEAIVGSLNNLEERPTKIPVEIDAAAKKETLKEMEDILGIDYMMMTGMIVETDEAEQATDDFIYGPHLPVKTEIEVDTDEADRVVNDFIDKGWPKIKIGIEFDMPEIPSRVHVPGIPYSQGGLVTAAAGLNLGGSGAVPAILHPPELVLNGDQALNVVWNMANQKQDLGKSDKLDLSGKIHIQVDGEGASHLNESLVSELVTTKLIKEIKEESVRK